MSICVHLSPGSQLVCLPTQTYVIVTTARILAVNLRVAFVRAGSYTRTRIDILAVFGLLWDIQLTFNWYGFRLSKDYQDIR